MDPSTLTRFMEKVEKTDSCWIWTGAKSDCGYGLLGVDGSMCYAHRLMWEHTNGPIPDKMFVCHDCPEGDNPACVNPEHLKLGTHQDNMDDMKNKGRGAKIKLSPETVEKILEMHNGIRYYTLSEIAKTCGVSRRKVEATIRNSA